MALVRYTKGLLLLMAACAGTLSAKFISSSDWNSVQQGYYIFTTARDAYDTLFGKEHSDAEFKKLKAKSIEEIDEEASRIMRSISDMNELDLRREAWNTIRALRQEMIMEMPGKSRRLIQGGHEWPSRHYPTKQAIEDEMRREETADKKRKLEEWKDKKSSRSSSRASSIAD